MISYISEEGINKNESIKEIQLTLDDFFGFNNFDVIFIEGINFLVGNPKGKINLGLIYEAKKKIFFKNVKFIKTLNSNSFNFTFKISLKASSTVSLINCNISNLHFNLKNDYLFEINAKIINIHNLIFYKISANYLRYGIKVHYFH